jgi:hypothetical protein
MSVDFAALAQAVLGGLAEVRVCLIVSRDGLVLGAQPPNKESRALDIWGRMTGLGDVERGFAVVGDELWSFCRRGPYSALAIADPTARPGVILDRLERTLVIAEDDRVRSDALRQAAETDSAHPRRLRTPLHREAKPDVDAPEVVSQREERGAPAWAERFKDVAQARAGDARDQGTKPSPEYIEDVPEEVSGSEAHSDEDAWSVDTAALRREFHGLVE